MPLQICHLESCHWQAAILLRPSTHVLASHECALKDEIATCLATFGVLAGPHYLDGEPRPHGNICFWSCAASLQRPSRVHESKRGSGERILALDGRRHSETSNHSLWVRVLRCECYLAQLLAPWIYPSRGISPSAEDIPALSSTAAGSPSHSAFGRSQALLRESTDLLMAPNSELRPFLADEQWS
jgi:hypothetical protein